MITKWLIDVKLKDGFIIKNVPLRIYENNEKIKKDDDGNIIWSLTKMDYDYDNEYVVMAIMMNHLDNKEIFEIDYLEGLSNLEKKEYEKEYQKVDTYLIS